MQYKNLWPFDGAFVCDPVVHIRRHFVLNLVSHVPVGFGLWEWDFGYAEVGDRGFFIQELVTFLATTAFV